MRAEAQAHIDQINAATALLRRFLDWDRANKRLAELNAKVEDSALWDDPKAAQEVMRERQRLEQAIGATRAIERELSDTADEMSTYRYRIDRCPAVPASVGDLSGTASVARFGSSGVERHGVGQSAAEPGREANVVHAAGNSVSHRKYVSNK